MPRPGPDIQIPPIHPADFEWLCGIIETSANFHIEKGNVRPRLRIIVKDRATTERCQSITGLGTVSYRKPTRSRKGLWVWSVASIRAVHALIKFIRPYLSERRGVQADKLLVSEPKRVRREYGRPCANGHILTMSNTRPNDRNNTLDCKQCAREDRARQARMSLTPTQQRQPPIDGEQWKPVVGFEDLYEVSDLGRIRSLRQWTRGRHGILASVLKDAYPQVTLARNGKFVKRRVHSLVLETFVGPCPTGMECRHLDGIKTNNRLDNLLWGTHLDNEADKLIHGTRPLGDKHWMRVRPELIARGQDNPLTKLSADQAMSIRLRNIAGENQKSLAREFGVSQATISRTINRQQEGA